MKVAPGRVSPLVEDLGDGRYRVTVAFHDPEAEDIWISGGLAGAEPADRRMRRSADGWWERMYELPHGVRAGYWFTRTLTPSGESDLVPDPLNPRRHVYPGDPERNDEDVETSLIELPGAPDRRWSVERAGVPRGETTLHRFGSEQLDNERRVFTYRPVDYDDSITYPLVICFDGSAYVHDAYVPLPTVLDNLIADGAIQPVVAVLPDSLDGETRTRELSLHDPFVSFLADELLPWAHAELSFGADPARTVVAGSSLGGLAAAHAALRRPDLFGLVLSQSGSFQRGLPDEFARRELLPLRLHLDVGMLETMPFERLGSLYHANLHMRNVLVAKGYDVTFAEFAGGHDYFWWRETIADGLVALLG